MVFDVVEFKNNESFLKQVKVLCGIQEIIKLPSLVVGFEYIKKILDIKILFLDLVLFECDYKNITKEFVEGIKARKSDLFSSSSL